MRTTFLVLSIFLVTASLRAQTDSLRRDSLRATISASTQKHDSLSSGPKIKPLTWQQDTAFQKFFINKNYPKNKQSVYAINAVRQPAHEDEQFYILAGLLLFAGIIRALYPKYFTAVFGVFFQSAQRQSKENIAQEALPSLLMNLLFVFSGGLLLASFVRGDDILQRFSFPLLWLYSCAALTAIYVVKWLFISFFGWSFSVTEAAKGYRFIVFLVNKVAGLFFLPLLLILTYSSGADFSIISTIAVVLVVLLLLYRYIVSVSTVGKKLKINPVHFFLYLCAVEILPLLITYKVLLITKEL